MRILLGLLLLGMTAVAYPQASKKPFKLHLSTDKPVVKSGDLVYIQVLMTNISDHDVDCTRNWRNALDRNYGYDVKDENGQPVPEIVKQPPTFRLSPCIIAPGETSSLSGGVISTLYDFSRPGKYTIQVSRGVWGDNNRPGTAGTGDNNQADVKSNTITITVLPAEASPPAKP
jgi:hypothetical protein